MSYVVTSPSTRLTYNRKQNIVVDGKAGDACYFLFHNHFLPKKRNVKSRKRRHYTASTAKLQGLHPGGQRAESVS
ncbi:MAG: hypothetical protein ACLUMK_05200 [Christensenellales bacterium]